MAEIVVFAGLHSASPQSRHGATGSQSTLEIATAISAVRRSQQRGVLPWKGLR
jgi:hypothetical protein